MFKNFDCVYIQIGFLGNYGSGYWFRFFDGVYIILKFEVLILYLYT